MDSFVTLRVPTARRTEKGPRPLVKFLAKKSDGSPFTAVTLPVGCMARCMDGTEADVSFHEFTVPSRWVYTAHDKRDGECAEDVGLALVLMPTRGKDGDFAVTLRRDMGDYDDDGSYVSSPVERKVSSVELAACLERQRAEYASRARQGARQGRAGDSPRDAMRDSAAEAEARNFGKRQPGAY